MKRLLIAIMLLLLCGNISMAEESSLTEKIFNMDSLPLKALTDALKSSDAPSLADAKTSGMSAATDLHPGKALLLSAIIPGMGEYYSGQKLKAALFFAVEVAAWTGVVYYYGQGKDKEEEFETYADAHFNEDVYRQVELDLARNQLIPESNPKEFTGTDAEWLLLTWGDKIEYLPRGGFTHELPTQGQRDSNRSLDQQYYEMIGKYVHQFGFGWDDVFTILSPGVYGFAGDSLNTYFYDNNNGTAAQSASHMDMRHDSNQLLDMSAWGYKIAILNHVASALDASFSVRMMRRNARAELSFRQVRYDRDWVPAGGLSIKW